MLFAVDVINNEYAEFRDCECGSFNVFFDYWTTKREEEIFVQCEDCGRRTKSIVRPINRTRLQDVDKVIEYWNHRQVVNDG